MVGPNRTVSDAQIREVFVKHGFTIKPGNDDLQPYVYAAARALVESVGVGEAAVPRHGEVTVDGAVMCCEEHDREPCPHDPAQRCPSCPGGSARNQKQDGANCAEKGKQGLPVSEEGSVAPVEDDSDGNGMGLRCDVASMARELFAVWSTAEPRSLVTRHRECYADAFRVMAQAAIKAAGAEYETMRGVVEGVAAWYASVDDTTKTQDFIHEMRRRARRVVRYGMPKDEPSQKQASESGEVERPKWMLPLDDAIRICNEHRVSVYAVQSVAHAVHMVKEAELASVVGERDGLVEELDSVLGDWNAIVSASGSRTHGAAIGHVRKMRDDIEAMASALKPLAKAGTAAERQALTDEDSRRAMEAMSAAWKWDAVVGSQQWGERVAEDGHGKPLESGCQGLKGGVMPTADDARQALDSMDDYARMDKGVDAMGARGVLERFIEGAADRCQAPNCLCSEIGWRLCEKRAAKAVALSSVAGTIEELLAQAMNVAVANGANSVSMPDKYVELAMWIADVARNTPASKGLGDDTTGGAG